MDEVRGVLVAPTMDGDLRVRFVELLDDHVTVYFSNFDLPPVSEDPRENARALQARLDSVALADDLGTDYNPCGAGAGRTGSGPVRGEARFSPAVPLDAQELLVSTPRHTITLRLSDLAVSPRGP
jgi:hypothetical protein